MKHDDWISGDFIGLGFGPRFWAFGPGMKGKGRGRRRKQMFESGEVKYVILRLLREKPRHGYEIMKELEDRLCGWYSASAGTVYPTLQMLEDQGYVRAVETEGKKVYHITPEGEAFLDEHRDVVDEILDRVGEAVRSVAGGSMGDVNQAFGRLARLAFRTAWRAGPDSERTERIAEILRRAAKEIEDLGNGSSRARPDEDR